MLEPTAILILEFADGTIGRMQFYAEPTDEEIRTAVNKQPKKTARWSRASLSDFPDDPTFRDAWVMGDRGINIDMPKARDILRNRMREARVPLLAALDVTSMRALEAGDAAAVASVGAQKQALRDVTALPEIEAAQTPEALKAIWPDNLI